MSKKSPEYKKKRADRVKAKLQRARNKLVQEKKVNNQIAKLKMEFAEKIRPIRNMA